MLLHKTVELHLFCFLLGIAPCGNALCQRTTDIDSNKSAFTWCGKSYPEFCSQYGLGRPELGGMLRFRHEVGNEVVQVHLADQLTILAISVEDENGKAEHSYELLNQVVPFRPTLEWSGDHESLLEELPKWQAKSHLPFEKVFGKGQLFELLPMRTYFHKINGTQVVLRLDRTEIIRHIQWLDLAAPQWRTIEIRLSGEKEKAGKKKDRKGQESFLDER